VIFVLHKRSQTGRKNVRLAAVFRRLPAIHSLQNLISTHKETTATKLATNFVLQPTKYTAT